MKNPREVRPLSVRTDQWLRCHVPGWGEMRDKAVAAGMVDPVLPMTPQQKQKLEEISEIAERVRRRLVRVGADPRPAKPSNTE